MEGAVRPTIINLGPLWKKKSKRSLLSKALTSSVAEEEQEKAMHHTFELLDARTRSGILQY